MCLEEVNQMEFNYYYDNRKVNELRNISNYIQTTTVDTKNGIRLFVYYTKRSFLKSELYKELSSKSIKGSPDKIDIKRKMVSWEFPKSMADEIEDKYAYDGKDKFTENVIHNSE